MGFVGEIKQLLEAEWFKRVSFGGKGLQPARWKRQRENLVSDFHRVIQIFFCILAGLTALILLSVALDRMPTGEQT